MTENVHVRAQWDRVNTAVKRARDALGAAETADEEEHLSCCRRKQVDAGPGTADTGSTRDPPGYFK